MAFGAGALLFAVAIEMFAAGRCCYHEFSRVFENDLPRPKFTGLREVDRGESESKMHALVGASIAGALFYTFVNRCLSPIEGEKPKKAQDFAQVACKKVPLIRSALSTNLDFNQPRFAYLFQKDKEVDNLKDEESHTGNVAFSIWLGILIDGIPESMLIGFMQSEGASRSLNIRLLQSQSPI